MKDGMWARMEDKTDSSIRSGSYSWLQNATITFIFCSLGEYMASATEPVRVDACLWICWL